MIKILLIEDEPTLREEVAEWLHLEGYQVTTAADGVEGLDAAFRIHPDLVVCDVTMPRMDGHAVLLDLRSNPVTSTIPFIFVTARASHDDIRGGMDLGADDYITKPFTRIELLEAIQARLAKKATMEEAHQFEVEQWRHAFEQEQEQRILKAKLTAMFSHDFRTPLSIIASSNNIIRNYSDRMDDERRQTHFDRVDASVMQLLQMLDDMLMVAQMENNSLEFQVEPLKPAEFFQNILDEFQIVYLETHRLSLENSSPDVIQADSRLLRQIASNLISNALKYSPQGGEVSVNLHCDDGQLRLTVQDQGIGIPEADQERLLGEFQRGSNVGHLAGTGLGLAIVRQAVELYQGSISFTSKVGEGTRFTVLLPLP